MLLATGHSMEWVVMMLVGEIQVGGSVAAGDHADLTGLGTM